MRSPPRNSPTVLALALKERRMPSTRVIRAVVAFAVCLTGAGLLGGADGASGSVGASSISYAYDANGRLAAVIDPTQTNGVAVYSYDAAGNLTAIARQPTSSLS